MIGFVIWIIGLILTFRAAIEIWNINAAVEKRLIAIVLIVLTSWLGLLFYYFYGKERMAGWLKSCLHINLSQESNCSPVPDVLPSIDGQPVFPLSAPLPEQSLRS